MGFEWAPLLRHHQQRENRQCDGRGEPRVDAFDGGTLSPARVVGAPKEPAGLAWAWVTVSRSICLYRSQAVLEAEIINPPHASHKLFTKLGADDAARLLSLLYRDQAKHRSAIIVAQSNCSSPSTPRFHMLAFGPQRGRVTVPTFEQEVRVPNCRAGNSGSRSSTSFF
jgi:hypothetical protein